MASLEELREKLVLYEAQQEEAARTMRTEVATQVGQVAEGLRDLYSKADAALIKLARRIDELEAKDGGGGGKPKSLLNTKTMTLEKLEKTDEWRKWKADLEDYSEEIMPGIKEQLDRVRDSEDETMPRDEIHVGALMEHPVRSLCVSPF